MGTLWVSALLSVVACSRGKPVIVLSRPVADSMNAIFARSNEHWDELEDLTQLEKMLGTVRPTQKEYLGCLTGSRAGDTVRVEGWIPARNMKQLQFMEYSGGAQTWQDENLGYETIYKTITGGIFEFGFSDAILQMWAAFMDELVHGKAPYGCARPEEALESHRLFTAALESQRTHQAVELT